MSTITAAPDLPALASLTSRPYDRALRGAAPLLEAPMTVSAPVGPTRQRLPEDVITLCFTDVEASTPLMHRVGDAYPEILVTHRRLVREAFEAEHGLIISAQGEDLYAAFGSANCAVHASIAAHRALMDHPWPEDAQVRIRIGLHTGSPIWTPYEYVGLDVVRAARVSQAGYGGQTLLSGATVEALGDERSAFEFTDLGIHRLKGLARPERLYQVVAAGLPRHFPPPRTLTPYPDTLPVAATPLLGRAQELTDVQNLLGRSEVRLITLTGAGGTGKTRFATDIAVQTQHRFMGGVCYVPLAAVRDPSGVVPAIAQALGAHEGEDLAAIRAQLRDRQLLLILDNCEHVIEAAGDAASLLASCPQLKILATSREPLRISGEREYRLRPLRLPPPSSSAADIADSPAVQLFVERARSLRPGFVLDDTNARAVAAICAKLDGLPLAIELVAARSRLQSPEQLLARLEDPLAMAANGPRDLPARQQSLRATIAWSYDPLPADERTVFRHLAVFAGSFTPEAVEAVVPEELRGPELLDQLEALTNKSLVRLDAASATARFSLLETIREFALDRLEAEGEAPAARDRHLKYYRDLVARSSRAATQADHVAAVAAEISNVREALRWASTSPGQAEVGLSLASAVGSYWWQRGVAEGIRWTEQFLRYATSARPALRAAGLYWQAYLTLESRSVEEAVALSSLAVEEASAAAGGALIMPLNILSDCLIRAGETARALEVGREAVALARANADPRLAVVLWPFGLAAFDLGMYADARDAWEESCQLFGDLGDESLLAQPFLGLANLALREGEFRAAEERVRTCLALLRRTGDLPRMSEALALLARVRVHQRRQEDAVSCLCEALESARAPLARDSDGVKSPAWALTAAAEFCAIARSMEDAVTIIAAATATANGAQIRAVQREEIRAILHDASVALSPAELARAEAVGRAMGSAAAVEFALEAVTGV